MLIAAPLVLPISIFWSLLNC